MRSGPTVADIQVNLADKDALAFYQLLLSDAFGADSNRVKVLLNQQATQNRRMAGPDLPV